jgi:ATP-dependent DNA helicase RecQ
VPDTAVTTARGRLERAGVELEPRSQWPTGMERLGVPLKGRIDAGEAMAPGRALARLSDLGWGQRLRELFRGADGPVPAEVLRACVPVLREWPWEDRPVAVAAVPSRTRPQLVTSLGEGLAEMGRMQGLGSLEPVHGGPTGGPGGNSAFRLAGVWGRLVAGQALADRLSGLQGPVLHVDDLVSSRWTLTVAAAELRRAGAPGVLPFALAVDG